MNTAQARLDPTVKTSHVLHRLLWFDEVPRTSRLTLKRAEISGTHGMSLVALERWISDAVFADNPQYEPVVRDPQLRSQPYFDEEI